jgi:hypothetical protein
MTDVAVFDPRVCTRGEVPWLTVLGAPVPAKVTGP